MLYTMEKNGRKFGYSVKFFSKFISARILLQKYMEVGHILRTGIC